MLNWIAIFGGTYLYEIGGPLQGPQESIPRSDEVFESAELWPIWGSLPSLRWDLHRALRARGLRGDPEPDDSRFEVRAVGFNPEAARYSGISVAKNYFLAMAIAGPSPVSPDRSTSSGSSPASTSATTARTSSRLRASRSPSWDGRRPSASSSQPPLRRARGRHLDPPARSRGLRARARGRPRDDDPGARDLLRRRRAPHRLHLAGKNTVAPWRRGPAGGDLVSTPSRPRLSATGFASSPSRARSPFSASSAASSPSGSRCRPGRFAPPGHRSQPGSLRSRAA